MKIKRKVLTTLVVVFSMLLFFSVPVFAETNDETKPVITSIEVMNGKITVNFNRSVSGLNIDDFNITTLLSSDECTLPGLTFNSEDNSFTFESLYNKSFKRHILTVIVSAAEASTKITGSSNAAMVLKPHGGVSIILNWDRLPEDLDAHLVLPNGNEVYHSNKNVYDDNGNLVAKLEEDKSHAEGAPSGPEKIIVYKVYNGTYQYYVQNWSAYFDPNNQTLSEYGATVDVYVNGKLTNNFQTPKEESGYIWNVFEIVNGKVVPINTITTPEVEPV